MYDYIPPQQKTNVIQQNIKTSKQDTNPFLAGLVVQQFNFKTNPTVLDASSSENNTSNEPLPNNQQIAQTYGDRDGYTDNFSQDLNTLFKKFENVSVNFYTIKEWEKAQCLSVIRNFKYEYGYLPQYLRYTRIPKQKSEEIKLLEAHACNLILNINKISRIVTNSVEINDYSAGDIYQSESYREAFNFLILYHEELQYTLNTRKKVLQK